MDFCFVLEVECVSIILIPRTSPIEKSSVFDNCLYILKILCVSSCMFFFLTDLLLSSSVNEVRLLRSPACSGSTKLVQRPRWRRVTYEEDECAESTFGLRARSRSQPTSYLRDEQSCIARKKPNSSTVPRGLPSTTLTRESSGSPRRLRVKGERPRGQCGN